MGIVSLFFLAVSAHQPILGVHGFLWFHLGGVGVREHNPFAAAIVLFYYLVDVLASAVPVCELAGHWGFCELSS